MATTGTQKYFYEGEPATSGATGSLNTGQQRYFYEGEPVLYKNNAVSTTARVFAFIIG